MIPADSVQRWRNRISEYVPLVREGRFICPEPGEDDDDEDELMRMMMLETQVSHKQILTVFPYVFV